MRVDLSRSLDLRGHAIVLAQTQEHDATHIIQGQREWVELQRPVVLRQRLLRAAGRQEVDGVELVSRHIVRD